MRPAGSFAGAGRIVLVAVRGERFGTSAATTARQKDVSLSRDVVRARRAGGEVKL